MIHLLDAPKWRCFLLWGLLVLGYVRTSAQMQYSLPPAPTASALGKFVDNPVSLHTGTPSISVPIYEIKLRDFSLPVSLSYNPQDIQVNTTASNVGLGWSLMAGGVITRVVRDVKDDWRQDSCDPNEYDISVEHSIGGNFPYCHWGYLYAISSGTPFLDHNSHTGAEWGYYGTTTYNLDLDAIYQNRGFNRPATPEHHILERFGYSYWGSDANVGSNEEQASYLGPFLVQKNGVKYFADREPDIFYFNFGGFSGKFVFDVEHGTPKIKTVPYQDLRFTYKTNPTTGALIEFSATDNKGVVYTFKDIETTTIYERADSGTGRRSIYNSSWWLTQVVTPMGEVLNFTYQDEQINTISETFTPRRYRYYSLDPANETTHSQTQSTTNSKRLSAIFNGDLHIALDATHVRTDLTAQSNGKAITSLTISAKSFGALRRLKKYVLDYDYFLSSESKVVAGHNGNKRLRLLSIQEEGHVSSDTHPKYLFEYNYYDQGSQYAAHKKFPNLYTFNLDLWGYANGANNVTPIPAHNIYPDHFPKGDLRMFSIYTKNNYTGRHFTTVGGNRIPNADYMGIGVLSKVTYPTGGATSYQYEPHRFVMDGEEYIGGGLRIRSIVKDDGMGNLLTHNYSYNKTGTGTVSSGKIVMLPMYANLPVTDNLTNPQSGALFEDFATEESALKNSSGFYSFSISELGRSQGSNVGYTSVTESMSSGSGAGAVDNGRTEYRYSFPAAFAEPNDVLGGGCSILENGICDGLYSTTRIHNFFMYGYDRSEGRLEYYPETSLSHLTPPNPIYDWNRGLLLSKKHYTSGGTLRQEEQYQYKNYFPLGATAPTSVYGIKMVDVSVYTNFGGHYTSPNFAFRVAKYEIFTDVAKVVSKHIVTDYPQAGGAVSRETSYSYLGNSHMNPTVVSDRGSDGKDRERRLKYALDYSFATPPALEIYQMGVRNMSSSPIEELSYVKSAGVSELVGAKLNLYRYENGKVLMDKVFAVENSEPITGFQESSTQYEMFNMDGRYKQQGSFEIYDSKGNAVQLVDQQGIVNSGIWDYGQNYLVAAVKNAPLSDIGYVSFEGGGSGGFELSGQVSSEAGGNRFYSLVGGGSIAKYNLNSSKTYQVTMRFRASDGSAPGNGFVKVSGPDAQGWSVYVRKFSGLSSFVFASVDVAIDDVRLCPVGAMMTSYTYDPLVGMTSMTDAKGLTSYYEYDGFQRLRFVKDQDGNIIKSYCYNYVGQSVDCNALPSSGVTTPPVSDCMKYKIVVPNGSPSQVTITYVPCSGGSAVTVNLNTLDQTPEGNGVSVELCGLGGVQGFEVLGYGPGTPGIPVNATVTVVGNCQ